jgi:hypothetical protein
MSVKSSKNKDAQPLAPAPSVLDAINASRGGRGLEPLHDDSDDSADPSDEETHEEPAADDRSIETNVVEDEPAPVVDRSANVTAALRAQRARNEATAARLKDRDSAAARQSAPASSVDELGEYVTRVMVDARRAASEFLASVDGDAHRRAAAIVGQADIEARSLREAALAEADKIRSDAQLEGDRRVAERLRIAFDLTDQLYQQAEQILADADRPDIARRNLARFVTALTTTAEDAAAAAAVDDDARS